MRSVALLFFGIHLVFAGTRSLQYLCTTVYRKMNMEKYMVVGMIDDLQFMHFDSNTMKAVPKTDWMRQNEGKDYWNVRTQTVIGHYKEYQNFMQTVMLLYNQPMSGYLQYGYNGEDFISFDKNTLTWSAANPQADIIINKWDTDGAKTKYWKAYLESTCLERMKKIVSYGKDTLERKDAPVVSLLQKNSSSPVICHATSFFPKNITMTWKKNNEDQNEDVEVSSTLPNEDGTFQRRISLSVKSEEWKKNPDVFRCVIQHVGEEFSVFLNENNIKTNLDSNVIAITVVCLVVLILSSAVGLIVWKKSREGNRSNPTGTDVVSKSDANSLENPTPSDQPSMNIPLMQKN